MNKKESLSSRNYDTQQFPYNPESFRTFVQILLRLFHDSPAIVVGDCLIREQKSFTDRDLATKLSLSDRQVREALRQLEEDLIVVKDQKNNDGSQNSISMDQIYNNNAMSNNGVLSLSTDIDNKNNNNNSISNYSNRMSAAFYRINPYLPTVVEWQYNAMMHEIDQEIKDASSLDELICKRCNAKYSSLQALSLDLSPDDGLFLCRYCNEKLKSVDSASFRNSAKDKAERARNQLQILSKSLELVRNMHIPVFPPYQNKNDKGKNLKSDEESLNKTNVSNTINKIENLDKKGLNNNLVVTANVDNFSSSINTNTATNLQIPNVISKVKFGIKLSTKTTNTANLSNFSNIALKTDLSNQIKNINGIQSEGNIKNKLPRLSGSFVNESRDNNLNSNSDKSRESVEVSNELIEEPIFSVSAIKDKIFKITEISDDVIDKMTDSEYLKYDELLQQYQTIDLLNS